MRKKGKQQDGEVKKSVEVFGGVVPCRRWNRKNMGFDCGAASEQVAATASQAAVGGEGGEGAREVGVSVPTNLRQSALARQRPASSISLLSDRASLGEQDGVPWVLLIKQGYNLACSPVSARPRTRSDRLAASSMKRRDCLFRGGNGHDVRNTCLD